MKLILFGPGFVGSHIAAAFEARGASLTLVRRATESAEVFAALAEATHIITTVATTDGVDPILDAYGDAIRASPAGWIGYVSNTGVYGNWDGAWVDEDSELRGAAGKRIETDLAWGRMGAFVFRMPSIYGPGRSVLDRVRIGREPRLDVPGQVFSFVHVDDVVKAIMASLDRGAPGVYNIGDDLPAPQNDVIAYACELLDVPLPPLQNFEEADLHPLIRQFYTQNRRVANGKAKRELGWEPTYPTYREGLRAQFEAETAPA